MGWSAKRQQPVSNFLPLRPFFAGLIVDCTLDKTFLLQPRDELTNFAGG